MIEISTRLHTLAQLVPEGSRVADIGSDHAYLPTYLIQSGRSPFVIAGEVNEGPYQSARKQVEQEGLQEQISVRKGDGLAVIKEGEIDVITIAGMGGALIVQILTEGFQKLSSIKRLILQPNVGEAFVRRFGIEHGWQLIDETILEEDGKIYEVLCFFPGDGVEPYKNYSQPLEILIKMGPYLIQEKNEIFCKKWERELEGMEKVIQALSNANTEESRQKQKRLTEEYEAIKGVLQRRCKGNESFNI